MPLARFFSFWAYPLSALLLWILARSVDPDYPFAGILLWLAVGLLSWTLLEYSLHRFLFHWRPENRRLRRFIAQMHLVHHGDTHNPDEILVRPLFSLPVSLVLLALFFWLLSSFSAALGILSGIWIGFLFYEAVHYRVHLSKKSSGLLQYQRRIHFIHHFVDDRTCFGVTTPLWDILFGTYRRLDS